MQWTIIRINGQTSSYTFIVYNDLKVWKRIGNDIISDNW